jgi:glycerate kinase
MNILLAPDKFKVTLSAQQVCEALESGFIVSDRKFTIRKFPLADGGDGTLEIFLHHLKGKLVEVEVHDPLMRKIRATYALSHDEKVAFVEMARASGLALLGEGERKPLDTSSYGTGELIADALDRGVDKIIIGIGGSATTDGALGAAEALGFRCYDAANRPVVPCGGTLTKICMIDAQHANPRLKEVRITALCDVINPFCGKEGAGYVYGPQKGATPQEVVILDKGLQQLAMIYEKCFATDVRTIAGAGAGGGFAGGAVALFNATLEPGAETVFELTGFRQALDWADVILTGEGKFDRQSFQGKVVGAVVKAASQAGKKVWVVCGVNEVPEPEWRSLGICAVFDLISYAGLHQAVRKPAETLRTLTRDVLVPKLRHLAGC